MDLKWEHCALLMHQLQSVAQQLQLRKHDKQTKRFLLILLHAMQDFRQVINEVVLVDGQQVNTDNFYFMIEEIQTILQRASAEGISFPTQANMVQERDLLIQKEFQAVHSLPISSEDCKNVTNLIQDYRDLEQSRKFHSMLLCTLTQKNSLYSADNFAYGHTPFHTWLKVCSHRVVRQVLKQSADAQSNQLTQKSPVVDTPIVIFGSSSGSLVSFTSVILDVMCTGVEILPYLHNVALEMKQRFPSTTHKSTFINADMIHTTLVNTRVLVLTSQCWDHKLYHEFVRSKIEKELDEGAIVIDYRNGLNQSPYFRLVQCLENLTVSWNANQRLYLYERWNR